MQSNRIEIEDLTFMALCGGEGRRMNGSDKPLLSWQGKPLLDHLLASVPAEVGRLISANRNLDEYAHRGRVITDSDVPGPDSLKGAIKGQSQGSVKGPLKGILAGLHACETRALLVAPGDAPLLPELWWQRMLTTFNSSSSPVDAVVLQDPLRQQNLHLLLDTKPCLESLEAYIASGKYQVYLWLEQLRVLPCRIEQEVPNFNEASDFER